MYIGLLLVLLVLAGDLSSFFISFFSFFSFFLPFFSFLPFFFLPIAFGASKAPLSSSSLSSAAKNGLSMDDHFSFPFSLSLFSLGCLTGLTLFFLFLPSLHPHRSCESERTETKRAVAGRLPFLHLLAFHLRQLLHIECEVLSALLELEQHDAVVQVVVPHHLTDAAFRAVVV